MGNNHKSGHGTEMFRVFFVFIYLKTGRLFLRGVYLRPVRVYFKQDTGCVLMNQKRGFRPRFFIHAKWQKMSRKTARKSEIW